MLSTQPAYNPALNHQRSIQTQGKTPAAAAQPVQFAGAGELVSSFIGAIDKSRALELASSDGLGMLVPRVGVAAAFRGADDARETLIREGAGLLCVALLAGLTNRLMVKVLGNGVNLYNPHGTPADAWINAKSLRVFSNRYDEALKNSASIGDARTKFLSTILNDLESGDHKMSAAGQLNNLEALKKDIPQDVLSRLQTRLHSEDWGKLTAEGKQTLQDDHLKASTFDQDAWKAVKHLSGDKQEKAFLKERLALSLKAIKDEGKSLETMNKYALEHGLTNAVNLKGDLNGYSRDTLLKELKYFLHHYVDRAGHKAQRTVGDTGNKWKTDIQKTLFAAEGGIKKLWPSSKDGLVTATMKSKMAYTWVPISVAIAANGLTTFLNNYVTQQKYGGQVFFPGEEAFVNRPPMGNPFQRGAQ